MGNIIPNTFIRNNEDYFTLPCIKKFIKNNNITKGDDKSIREDLIGLIEEFGKSSSENKEVVLNWADEILKEGIKDLHLTGYNYNDKPVNLEKVKLLLESKLLDKKGRHICEARHTYSEQLLNFKIHNTELGQTISLVFSRLFTLYRKEQKESVIYPIFIDIYIDKKLISGRAKSKSDLYYEDISEFDIKTAKSAKADKIIRNTIDEVLQIFGWSSNYKRGFYQENLYMLLEKYTFTPKEINDILDNNISLINDFVPDFISAFGIPQVADKKIKDDLLTIAEKYISVYWPKPQIFTENRQAYPTKLNTTDDEESKLQQSAAENEPLQSKEIFFDNKRMLNYVKRCDSVRFVFRRKYRMYFSVSFDVIIQSDNKYCILKFPGYTEECDIENVLLEVINPQRDIE